MSQSRRDRDDIPTITAEHLRRIADPTEAEARHRELLERAANDPELRQAVAERNRLLEQDDKERKPIAPRDNAESERPVETQPKGHRRAEPLDEAADEEHSRWLLKVLALLALSAVIVAGVVLLLR